MRLRWPRPLHPNFQRALTAQVVALGPFRAATWPMHSFAGAKGFRGDGKLAAATKYPSVIR